MVKGTLPVPAPVPVSVPVPVPVAVPGITPSDLFDGKEDAAVASPLEVMVGLVAAVPLGATPDACMKDGVDGGGGAWWRGLRPHRTL